MVKIIKGNSEPQHVTGKPGIRGGIVPSFTIGMRFIGLVILVALLIGGVVGFTVIKTSKDSHALKISLT